MPFSPIPPNLSTSQYQQLVLELLNNIGGPGSLDIQPPILSTSDFRHLVLYALNYIATNGTGANRFIDLQDAPSSYAGFAGYTVAVKGDESGLEFSLGSGSVPSGPAGGDLAGSYPNPTIKSSVNLSGVPTAATAANGTNTTQIATTAFVQSSLLSGIAKSSNLIATVVNADSVALARGTVVYAFGSTGNKLSVKRADNSSDATSATTLGFVNDLSLAAGAQGTITLYGSMDQLNLGSPFVDGDQIWLGTSGGFVKTRPTAPNNSVFLGVVERANSGNGIAYVKVQNGYELDELHDVLIAGTTAGQVLTRNAANNLWENENIFISAANLASFPVTGKFQKVYIAQDTWKTYSWNGSGYTEISPNTHTRAGSNNTFVNDTALASASLSGPNNTAVGTNALNANTTGGQNTAVGTTALQYNSLAEYNTAVGFASMSSNAVTGSFNTGVGIQACRDNANGTQNTAVGAGSLRDNTNGAGNTAVGFTALISSTSSGNTAIGTQAGDSLTTGANNTIVGTSADVAGSGRNLCVVIGSNAQSPALDGTLSIGGTVGAAMSNLTTSTPPAGATSYLRVWLNGQEYRILIQQP